MNLIQRLLGREAKPKPKEWFDAYRVKPFFKANGVDIETIGFPKIATGLEVTSKDYCAFFSNVSATPTRVDNTHSLRTVISGDYHIMPAAIPSDREGKWPAESYSFTIEDNKLTLQRRTQ